MMTGNKSPPQGEGFSVESQREESTYTELVPVPVSQNDYSRSSQRSMSSQRSTSSQYPSHDESIGDFSGQPSTSSQHQSPDESIGEFSSQPSTSSQHQSPDESIGDSSGQRSTSSQYPCHDASIGDLDVFIDAYMKELKFKDNSGDAESLPSFDMLSKSLINEESHSSEDESSQALSDKVFGASVLGALQQTG